MKKIEDVIKAYECKKSIEDKCNECPYFSECDDKYHCECEARDDDALYYLKEYSDDRKNFSEAISNCGKALNKYIMDIQALAQQEENLPLTWNELKDMIGKPIWVERTEKYCVPHWAIIENVIEWDSIPYGTLLLQPDDEELYISDHAKTWRAYRKEQK